MYCNQKLWWSNHGNWFLILKRTCYVFCVFAPCLSPLSGSQEAPGRSPRTLFVFTDFRVQLQTSWASSSMLLIILILIIQNHPWSFIHIVVNVTMVRTACHECYEARSPREIIYADTLIYVGMGLQFATSYINWLGWTEQRFHITYVHKHCHLPLKLFILWSCDVFNFWPVDFCSIDGLDCTKKTCYLSHLKLPSTDWSRKCRGCFFLQRRFWKTSQWQRKLGGNKSMKNSLPKSKKGPSGPQPTLEGTLKKKSPHDSDH